ncbi:MAG: DNA polymerase Y family protein [Phycisphaerales bacterium]|nr:DNA polymerase Y family protein [Phycisphaerales bacterium]
MVAAACAQCRFRGARPGMALAEAEELLAPSHAHTVLADPAGDAAALRALAIWMRRFCPLVELDSPDGLRLDIRGCGHLFGGDALLLENLREDLRRIRVAAVVVAAATFAKAWGIARFGGSDFDRTQCDELPIAALGLDGGVEEACDEVAIETVAQLKAIPRIELAARFGDAVLTRLDAWSGAEPELPIDGRAPEDRIRAEQVFDGPVRDLETVQLVVWQLAGEIAESLAARQRGAEQLDLHLGRVDRPDWNWSFRMTRASHDVAHFRTVLRDRVDRVDVASGVETVSVCVTRNAVLSPRQRTAWIKRDPNRVGRARAALEDLLRTRCGRDRVLTRCLVDTHVPECADGFQEKTAATSGSTVDASSLRADEVDRPTRIVLPRRIEVRLPCAETAGWVRGNRLRWWVIEAVGPERLETPWWIPGRDWQSRDYWRLLRDDGQWLWVYRCDGRWFLQGAWL